jgi:hypothetical protein
MQESRYLCKCSNSWAGEDCSIRLETNCSDDIDNDDGERFSFFLFPKHSYPCTLTLVVCIGGDVGESFFYRYSGPVPTTIFHPSIFCPLPPRLLIMHSHLVQSGPGGGDASSLFYIPEQNQLKALVDIRQTHA